MSRAGRAGRAALVGVVMGALLSLSPSQAGAAAAPTQVETTVPTAVAGPGSTVAPDQADADAGDGSSTVVGDPVADRRIRRIVIALCAVALAVLVVTVLFWRATRPVPRVLRGLQELGSRSGRRRVAAASNDAPEPVAASVSPALVPAAGTASLPDDG